MAAFLGLDIGSNSVGSFWFDAQGGRLAAGTSVFPAGVEETDDKRGEPRNAKRRMARRTRITLARRAQRKRELKKKLVGVGLLPSGAGEFKELLEATDPWELRRTGLDRKLAPHEFGRVLLHLAQRRGALGLRTVDIESGDDLDGDGDGPVKAAIGAVQAKMREGGARTFGEFIATLRQQRITPITTEDRRREPLRKGPREYRDRIRNKANNYEHCADRAMVRHEFAKLWEKQASFGGPLAEALTDELRVALDDESGDTAWKHKGLLFGQRRSSWDLGTLGRCTLHPTERCLPHADVYASRYLVVETVNNLKIIEQGMEPRSLTPSERRTIKDYLSGPLGIEKRGKRKGQPKQSVSVSDLRDLMGWGRASKTAHFRFNVESDEDRVINTDWFSREIIHGAVTREKWQAMPERVREGLNRAILKYDPEDAGHALKLREGAMAWAGLDEAQAERLLTAWKRRPKPDAKRLNMSRRAVRNLLEKMDAEVPYPDRSRPGHTRWLTQIEARKLIAEDSAFCDTTTCEPLDDHTRRRYATGAKGATASDRHYMRKHLLANGGEAVRGPDGQPLSEPPPAPLVSNPVVRKAIHEVRRHLVEYMKTFGRKPDRIFVELSREAKMGKKDADAMLLKNRLRNRIRNDIIREFSLHSKTATQQRAAVDRVVLAVQQRCVCPLCGKTEAGDGSGGITLLNAAKGDGCEAAHIIPKACGGNNGLGNIVLAHTKCNRDMGRRTPREFWGAKLDGGFSAGISWVENIYEGVERQKPKEARGVTGNSLWALYFNRRDDQAKIDQFKREVKDLPAMTQRQGEATKYAARQVMAYLSDAIFDSAGLPERGGERRIFATDGLWTSRLRREWGLFFDPHGARDHKLEGEEKRLRKEKDRGDHRHHAVDAAAIACCSPQVQEAWEARERKAENDGVNTADEEAMEIYRRQHPLPPPAPFKTREDFRGAIWRAVFGDGETERPICHRPVKRKLTGALHEETLFGPVLDSAGSLTNSYTGRKDVQKLTPAHLRMPRDETAAEAVERLAARRSRLMNVDRKTAVRWAKSVVESPGYVAAKVDPKPGKSGIVRDIALRARIRQCLAEAGYDPETFSDANITNILKSGGLRHLSGVPIRSVVLLRTMVDPVVTSRWASDHATGERYKEYDAETGEGNAAAARAYVGGNNHHIEIRAAKQKGGREKWTGKIVSAFEAAQRSIARQRALRAAGIPNARELRRLSEGERARLTARARDVERTNPIVDRRDHSDGGKFIMSLCEGETLLMKDKRTGKVGYFVVAKLDPNTRIMLVPHWDARSATARKDADLRDVPDSEREQLSVTPDDLRNLAPPGRPHAIKVRVTPLGTVMELAND